MLYGDGQKISTKRWEFGIREIENFVLALGRHRSWEIQRNYCTLNWIEHDKVRLGLVEEF